MTDKEDAREELKNSLQSIRKELVDADDWAIEADEEDIGQDIQDMLSSVESALYKLKG